MFLRKNIFLMFVLSFSLFGFVSAGNPIDVKRAWDKNENDLSYADLSWEFLDGIKLKNKTLVGVMFNNSSLIEANLSNSICYSREIEISEKEEEEVIESYADFHEADLTDAHLNNAGLEKCNFSRAVLKGTKFNGANLRGANFTGAIFDEHTDFTDAIVDGAIFDGVELLARRLQNYLRRNHANSPNPNSPKIGRFSPGKNPPSPSAFKWEVEIEDKECEPFEVFDIKEEESIVDRLERLSVGYSGCEKKTDKFYGICPWEI